MRKHHHLRQTVAGNVRAELGRARMSQSAAAAQIGMSQTALSRRLLAHAAFDTDELEALARILGVPVTKFFAGNELAAA
ncbi:helix-turn-helix domain-containing protein [Rhodococcus ruber]